VVRCVLGGTRQSADLNSEQAWLSSEAAGSFSAAATPPGLVPIEEAAHGGSNEFADVNAAACAGNTCVVGGSYTDAQGDELPFVDRAAGRSFRAAQTLPGMLPFLEKLGPSPVAGLIDGISCRATGACAVVGEAETTAQTDGSINSSGLYSTVVDPGAVATPKRIGFSLATKTANALSFVGSTVSAQGLTTMLLTDGTNYEISALGPGGLSTDTLVPVSGSFAIADASEGDLVSCWSAGNCYAVGQALTVTDAFGDTNSVLFSAQETNGSWGAEAAIPGSEGGANGSLSITQLSCASAASCALAGEGQFGSAGLSVFILPMTGRQWGTVEPLTGLDVYTGSQANSDLSDAFGLSCATTCTLTGEFLNAANNEQPFVATGGPGSLSTARPLVLPGTSGVDFQVSALNCPSSSSCRIAGEVFDKTAKVWVPAVTTETTKRWSAALEIPGAKAALTGPSAGQYAIGVLPYLTCPTANACEGVVLLESQSATRVYTSTLTGAKWSTIAPVPGWSSIADSFPLGYSLLGLACASAGDCVLAGSGGVNFGISNPTDLAFASSELKGKWSPTALLRANPAAKGATLFEAEAVGCSVKGACDVFGTYDLVYDQAQAGFELWRWAPIDVVVVQRSGPFWSAPVDLTTQLPGDVRPSAVSCTVGQCTLIATRWTIASGEQAVVSNVGG